MHKDNMHKGGFPHDPSIARFTWDPEAAGLDREGFHRRYDKLHRLSD